MANYLYNGIELPALPEYDKTLYPYAVIEAASGTRGELLTVMPSDAAYFSSNGYWYFGYQNYGSSNPKVGLSWKYDSTTDTWSEYTIRANITITSNSGAWFDTNEVWSNFDILNEDGSIYLAASDPVPVEPVDTKSLYYCKGGVWKRVYRKNNGCWEPVEVAVGNPAEVAEFNQLCAGLSTVDPFIFFTDPHLCEGVVWRPKFHEWMAKVKQVYDATPAKLVICGGDWIGNSDTKEQATSKLSYVREYMDKLFGGNCLLVLGNHDTNYQGTEQLTQDELIELWFKDTNTGKPYYYHDTETTRYFVLDTQTDWNPEWSEYFQEQRDWLAANLSADLKNVVVAHIDWVDSDLTTRTSLVDAIQYVDGVDMVLAGHIHADHVNMGAVPEVVTTNLQAGGVPTFDLCLLDVENNQLHTVRVGTGENRTINLGGA